MSTIKLRKLLIEKIQLTNDDKLLEEAFRLLDINIEDSNVYVLNDQQKQAIAEGRQQFINGDYLTEEESNKEMDKWLSK